MLGGKPFGMAAKPLAGVLLATQAVYLRGHGTGHSPCVQ